MRIDDRWGRWLGVFATIGVLFLLPLAALAVVFVVCTALSAKVFRWE